MKLIIGGVIALIIAITVGALVVNGTVSNQSSPAAATSSAETAEMIADNYEAMADNLSALADTTSVPIAPTKADEAAPIDRTATSERTALEPTPDPATEIGRDNWSGE